MVGFLRKKKSDKTVLSHDTALDRKGKIDGASLLDGNGDPTSGSLYDARNPNARRNSNQENSAYDNAAVNSNTFPPPYPQQQQQQYGGAFPTQQPQYNNNKSYPAAPPVMQTGFGNSVGGGYPRQYGAHNQQNAPQQYPVRYGAHQHQPQQSFGCPQQSTYGGQQQSTYGGQQQSTYGGAPQQQQQYPIQYGHYPPPMQPEAPKKSFFRIPSIGKSKN
jgi:hypothetical protein